MGSLALCCLSGIHWARRCLWSVTCCCRVFLSVSAGCPRSYNSLNHCLFRLPATPPYAAPRHTQFCHGNHGTKYCILVPADWQPPPDAATMTLPSVDRGRLLEAMKSFDENHRATPQWQAWETRRNHRYAIANDDRLYPVKEIVAIASGAPRTSFGGGDETNAYVRERGFTVESLDVPAENDVAPDLHDLLLARHPAGVTLREACDTLARRFELDVARQKDVLGKTLWSRWQDSVLAAWRKFLEEGIVKASPEEGPWQLATRSHPKVWVEKCLVGERTDRTRGEHALGQALWSPLRAQNMRDIYRNMRLVQPNDLILHLTDNSVFSATSAAASFARTDFEGISGTDWAGQRCYRIQLKEFRAVDPLLARSDISLTVPCVKSSPRSGPVTPTFSMIPISISTRAAILPRPRPSS